MLVSRVAVYLISSSFLKGIKFLNLHLVKLEIQAFTSYEPISYTRSPYLFKGIETNSHFPLIFPLCLTL
jgi:hypothetical protein